MSTLTSVQQEAHNDLYDHINYWIRGPWPHGEFFSIPHSCWYNLTSADKNIFKAVCKRYGQQEILFTPSTDSDPETSDNPDSDEDSD